eukprot:3191078-Rhodomonas_salina.1
MLSRLLRAARGTEAVRMVQSVHGTTRTHSAPRAYSAAHPLEQHMPGTTRPHCTPRARYTTCTRYTTRGTDRRVWAYQAPPSGPLGRLSLSVYCQEVRFRLNARPLLHSDCCHAQS